MNQEHLTYFKVENFKRFDSLELTDIGQFNLIVGDNNVGKTSILEALLFNNDRQKCLTFLHETLCSKGLHIHSEIIYGSKGDIKDVKHPHEIFLTYIFKSLSKELVFRSLLKNEDTNSVLIKFTDSNEQERINTYEYMNERNVATYMGKSTDNRYIEFSSEIGIHDISGLNIKRRTEIAGLYEHFHSQVVEMPLIRTSLSQGSYLPDMFSNTVNLSRNAKKQLVEDLKIILPDVEDFEVRKIDGNDQLLVGMRGKDELMPISIFGESVIRAAQILLEISKFRGKRLMIDEIDTGIHYSRMKKFLKTIFQVALKNDVQLFVTTHSLECQQAFQEVFEDVDMQEHQSKARSYSLVEKPDGHVAAQVFNFEQLQYALEIGFETRGGKRGW